MRRNKVLTISGVCVLGLGLGASALIFACLLGLTSPILSGMKTMSHATIAESTQGGGSEPITWRRFERIQSSNASRVAIAAYSRAIRLNAQASGKEVALSLAGISQGFWNAFTDHLTAGRDFHTNEEDACRPRALILSYKAAERIYTSPASAIGRVIALNGKAFMSSP